ncbi:hypothetical protein BaRGS_00019202 [Batillaria attramentaria]|uniref:Uncharacterized protein n=1 Tax=Batillaria attramentaria TaxID=370345 RepID=A0ABD0KRL8_9CAEN
MAPSLGSFVWVDGATLAMKLLLLTVLVSSILPSAASVSFCYFGSQDNVKALQNQSCATGELHHVSTDVIDYQDTEKPVLNMSVVTVPPRSQVSMCMVFRYIVKRTLSLYVTSRSVAANFSCDFQSWCKGRDPGFIYRNVTVNGRTGDVYCCNTNNCNTAAVIPQLPPQQQCYKNRIHWGQDYDTGTVVSCNVLPDAWCIRSRLYDVTPVATEYDCDADRQCQKFNMTTGSSSYVCRNVTRERGKEELCCCSHPVCFKPPSTSSASIFSTPVAQGQRAGRGNRLSAVTIGCIVAFTMLALIGGAVMVALMYQRRSLPDTSNLTLTYSRIEDDDVSDSIHML